MQLNNLSKPWKIALALVAVFILIKMFSSCSHEKNPLQVLRSVKVQRGDLEVKVTATGTVTDEIADLIGDVIACAGIRVTAKVIARVIEALIVRAIER